MHDEKKSPVASNWLIINNESRKKGDEKIDGSKDEVHSSLAKDWAR